LTLSTNLRLQFASVEEGGTYFGTLPQNPSAVGVTCAPVWQQDIQGGCNSKSLHLLD